MGDVNAVQLLIAMVARYLRPKITENLPRAGQIGVWSLLKII